MYPSWNCVRAFPLGSVQVYATQPLPAELCNRHPAKNKFISNFDLHFHHICRHSSFLSLAVSSHLTTTHTGSSFHSLEIAFIFFLFFFLQNIQFIFNAFIQRRDMFPHFIFLMQFSRSRVQHLLNRITNSVQFLFAIRHCIWSFIRFIYLCRSLSAQFMCLSNLLHFKLFILKVVCVCTMTKTMNIQYSWFVEWHSFLVAGVVIVASKNKQTNEHAHLSVSGHKFHLSTVCWSFGATIR